MKIVFNIILLSMLATACGDIKGSHFTAGSSDINENLTPSESVFPHKSTWAEPESHGSYVTNYGSDSCAGSCHGDNWEGGIGPSCKNCHENYPHEDGWGDKKKHGVFVNENGKSKCATKCHGADLAGGLSKIACDKCHSIYPHKAGFSAPDVHGAVAKGDGKAICTVCHGSDFLGGDTKVSCVSCHNGMYPHADGWSKKENHGAFVSENSKEACATKCHGTDFAGGLSGVSCEACHTVWPGEHKKEPWNAEGHGKKFLGLGKNACLGCHGQDWKGGKTEYSCLQCHDSLPEHYDDDLWGETAHGEYVSALGGDFSGCKLCHGANLEGKTFDDIGIKDIPACSSCHPNYPHAIDGTWEQNTADPTTAHGGYLMSGLQNLKDVYVKIEKECSSAYCHGSEGVANEKAPDCTKCHTTFPDAHKDSAAWPAKSGHGAEAKAQLESCQLCHGNDLAGGNSGSGCNNKCHAVIPEHYKDSWKETEHGKFVLIDDDKYDQFSPDGYSAKCQFCHGGIYPLNEFWPSGPVTTASETKMCYYCHPAYPHYEVLDSYDGSIYKWSNDPIYENYMHLSFLTAINSHFNDGNDPNDIIKDCGGASNGYCHNNTRQKKEKKSSQSKCNALCHSPK